jgi:hypothetical protein
MILDFPPAKPGLQLISLVRVVVRPQVSGSMNMIVRLQHVVGVIVLVALLACRVIVAVAVLMRVRMHVCVRMFMAVHLGAVTVLVPVGMGMLMLMVMPVLVTPSHGSVSFASVRPFCVFPRRNHFHGPLSRKRTQVARGLQQPG